MASSSFDYTPHMLDLRRLSPLLLLSVGLSSAGALSACGNPRTPEGASYKVEVGFQPAKGAVLSPGRPEDVQIVETTKSPPTGVFFGRGLALARDFPSPEAPHRDVGTFLLRETIEYNLDVFKDPAFAARRSDALKKALRACFKRIEQPSSSCTARYKGI